MTENQTEVEIPDIVRQYKDYLTLEKHFAGSTAKKRGAELVQFMLYLVELCQEPTSNTKPDKEKVLISAKTESIRAFLDNLKQEEHPKYPDKKKYTNTTINSKLSTLRSFYKFLVRKGHRNDNPAVQIKRLEEKKPPLPRFLEYEEVRKLVNAPSLNTIDGARDWAILETLYSTGISVSELVALNMDDIDFLGEVVHVRGKGKKERIAPIGSSALQVIQHYMEYRNKRAQRYGNFDSKALFVICAGKTKGRRIGTGRVREMMKKHLKKAGLDPDISPRVLRQSFAVHMLNNGADKRSVQELLGFQVLSSMQPYVQVSTLRSSKNVQSNVGLTEAYPAELSSRRSKFWCD